MSRLLPTAGLALLLTAGPAAGDGPPARDLGRVAYEHFARGQYKDALDCYTRWTPSNGCANCGAQLRGLRWRGMALCHLNLNDPAAAVRVCADGVRRYLDCGEGVPPGNLLFELYWSAGQSTDLAAILDALDKKLLADARITNPDDEKTARWLRQHLATGRVRDHMRVAVLGDKKDVPALIAACQDMGCSAADTAEEPAWHGPYRTAAEALARCGDAAVGPTRATILAAPAPRHVDAHSRGCVSWLIYALGRMRSPAARAALEDLAGQDNGWDTDNVAYALALHGEPGARVLRRLVWRGRPEMRAAANRRLAAPPPPGPGYPPPKPGSLPTRLPD